MKNTEVFSAYDNKVHLFGWVSTFVICAIFITVPFAIQFAFGMEVDGKKILFTLAAAMAVFGPIAICEFISYTPILGAGGMYLSFITGNIMNMKLPAAKNAQKICGAEEGSPEADAIAIIAIGVASIVTVILLIIGTLLIAQIAPILAKPVFKPAITHILPAIFAPLAIPAFIKAPKTASVPVAAAIVLTLIIGYTAVAANQSYILLVFLVLSVVWAYLLYKRGGNK
jgi:hypothetical protein